MLSLGNEVSQWQEEVSIGPGCPAQRNRIFGSGEIRDPENNVVFLDDMQPGDFFLIKKKKRHQLAGAGTVTAGVTCVTLGDRLHQTKAGYRCDGALHGRTWEMEGTSQPGCLGFTAPSSPGMPPAS